MLQEISLLFCQLPIAERLSLFLIIDDRCLVQGNTLLPLLPLTVQQFHSAFYYVYDEESNQDNAIIASWP